MPAITKEEILNSEIRALNLKQPYAELMKHGKAETRTWPTKYRGLVLIVASALPYADREILDISGEEQTARILQTLGPKWFNQVKRQNAIAIGRLIDCKPWAAKDASAWEDVTFVRFRLGLYVHFYADVTPIKSFPWRGTQGWKTLTAEEKLKIELL